MEIVITAWALNAYLDLKHRRVFTKNEFSEIIRPNVLLLKSYPESPEFNNSKLWSFATDGNGNRILDGYKMKWHNIGHGKVQLRLPVGMFKTAFLCEAYDKVDP